MVAQRATSLGPKPSLFSFCFFGFFFVFAFCFWGGFKGQVRRPKGTPHLALNPPYFLFLCFCFSFCFAFLSLFFNRKTVFPTKKGHFCCSFFCVSLCFFLAFLGPPPFSLSLSLSLPSFLFLISVSGSCFFFLFCFFLSSCSSVFFVCSACCLVLF